MPAESAERLAKVETEIKNLKSSTEVFRNENRQDHTLIFKKIDAFIDAANKTYATKEEVKEQVKKVDDKISDNTLFDRDWRKNLFPTLTSVATLGLMLAMFIMNIFFKGS